MRGGVCATCTLASANALKPTPLSMLAWLPVCVCLPCTYRHPATHAPPRIRPKTQTPPSHESQHHPPALPLDEQTGEAATDGDEHDAQLKAHEFTDIHGEHEEGLEDQVSSNINKGLGVTAAMRTTLNQMFNKDGVKILDVVITDVTQNPSIQKQLEGKTMVISENANERMTQQKTMKDIRNREELETMEQKFDEEFTQTEVDGKRIVSEAQLRLNNLKASVGKDIKEVATAGKVQIEQLQADTNLSITTLKQEAASVLSTYKAQAEAEAQKLRDEAELYCQTKRSEAELEVAKNRAQASRLLSQAEGEIAPMINALKEHETALKRLDMYRALAENPNVVIASSESKEMNAMLLADEVLTAHGSSSKAGEPPSRSVMMAEMLVGHKTMSLHLHEGNGDTSSGM